METTDELTVIDSEIQLSRRQIIRGTNTSIREAVRRSNRLQALSIDEFTVSRSKFDRGFCINVLSVIPFMAVRRRLLSVIHSRLRKGGSCLFVVQYR